MRIERIARAGALAGVTACALAACTPSSPTSSSSPRGPAPATVAIGGGDVIAGFAGGHLRQTQTVAAFRIAKSPITVSDYKACVDAGACTPPASRADACRALGAPGALQGPTYGREERSLPVTCATATQARAYCAWVGGALPKPSQWMLAARGATPRRYAWGDATPTCAERPDAIDPAGGGMCVPTTGTSAEALYAVGQHPQGASPSGVEDVLLAPGELLDVEPDAQFPACAPPRVGCVVRGERPGAIDGLEPIEAASQADDSVTTAAAFRCVFPEAT